MSSSSHKPAETQAQLKQRLRQQRDQLEAALAAFQTLNQTPDGNTNISNTNTTDTNTIDTALTTLRDTSVQLNSALRLADDLAAWCATFEASHKAQPTNQTTPTATDAPAWLEPVRTWAQQHPHPWSFGGHTPRWQLGMFSLLQVDANNVHKNNQDQQHQDKQHQDKQKAWLEVWLGDKHEYLSRVPADGRAIIDYLEAFISRPLPSGFVPTLQDSIDTLAADQPAAPVLEVLHLLEQRLGDTLTEHLSADYSTAAFAFDLFRVKTSANVRFVAASRAHKQRLWIPQDTQGRGMVCGWLACS